VSTDEFSSGHLPRKNAEIHLIRWLRAGDSWRNETLLVRYVGVTDDSWIVSSSAGRQVLPREEWALFST
jgi:hypothetical protein